MKHVVSVSLGSSRRDHRVEIDLKDQRFLVERVGTDGDFARAIKLLQDYDQKVDCIGLGGIDLYIYAGSRRYTIRDARRMKDTVKDTPVVDGSGLKNTLERMAVEKLSQRGIDFSNKNVFIVCGVDRFGLAQELDQKNCQLIFGDLLFAIGLPIAIHSLTSLYWIARLFAPLASRLPFHFLYPTGQKQESQPERNSRSAVYFQQADIIAGDFHYIRRHLPTGLHGNKIVLTNTVTPEDREFLKSRGITTLITTTPELEGRSFGTNVMEAILVAYSGRCQGLSTEEYRELLEELDFSPHIIRLQDEPRDTKSECRQTESREQAQALKEA